MRREAELAAQTHNARSSPVLEMNDVDSGYGNTVVLRGVSISIPVSAVVALLGPNGAGKTTLLRTCAGHVKPIRGRVMLNGVDVAGKRPCAITRSGLCHISEGRAIFPSLSVRENLVLMSPKGREQDSIARSVEVFPFLGGTMRRLAANLSGGQQQMLALARALISDPTVVVVDEPSMGLAPLIVDQVFEILRRIALNGTALLLVEQYISRALDLADSVYIMNQGRVVFEGPSNRVVEEDVLHHYFGVKGGEK